MTIHVTAIYTNGVLKPLKPLELEENEMVELDLTAPVKKRLPASDFGALYGIWRGLGDQLIVGLEEARRETNAKLERIAREFDEPYDATESSNE